MLPPSLLLPADVSLVCPVPACSTITTSPREYLEHAKKWHLPGTTENHDRLLNLLGHAFRKGEDRKKSVRKAEDKLQAQVAQNKWNPSMNSKYDEDYEEAQVDRCTVNMPRATIHKPPGRQELPPLDLSLLSPRRPVREGLGKLYGMKTTKPRILVTKRKSRRYFDYDVDADSRPITHPPSKVKKDDEAEERRPAQELSPPVQELSPPSTTAEDNAPIVKMEVVDTEYYEPPVPRESLTPPAVEVKSEVEEETETVATAATATAHVQASSGLIYPALVVPSKLGDSNHPVLLHRMGSKCYVFQWKLTQQNSERYVCLSCKMMKRTTGIRVINNMFQGDPERLPHVCQKRDWTKEAGNRKLYLHLQNLKDLKATPSPVAAYRSMMRGVYEEKEEHVEEGGNESLDERLNAFLASTSKETNLGQVAEPIPINHRKREKQICFRLGPQRYLQQGIPKVDIVCQSCGDTVRRIPSPTDHVHMHMHEEGCSPFECSLCDFMHHERTQVFRHMRIDHGRSDELIKDNRFIYAAQLKQITLSCFPNAVYFLKDPPHVAEIQALEGGAREVQIEIPNEPSSEFLNEIEEEEPYNSGIAYSQLTQLLGGKRYLTISSRRKDRVRLKCQFSGCGVTSDKPVDHAYHHMESKIFGCAFCPEITSTDRLEVWRHMRVIHNVAGAKVWDYRFRHAEELKTMMMACYPENFVDKPLPTKDEVLDLKWGTGYVVLD